MASRRRSSASRSRTTISTHKVEALAALDDVNWAAVVTGRYDIIVEVVTAEGMTGLYDFLNVSLQEVGGITFERGLRGHEGAATGGSRCRHDCGATGSTRAATMRGERAGRRAATRPEAAAALSIRKELTAVNDALIRRCIVFILHVRMPAMARITA